MQVHEFIARWSKNTLTERSGSQQHFLDICELLGHPKPADVDADGSSFTFEKGAKKTSGGDGWADVWKKGSFAWEYKGKHKNLIDAYGQLVKYHDDLGNPPLLVVSDMERFEVHTKFTNTDSKIHRFTIQELTKPDVFAVLRSVFENPDALRPGQVANNITEKAAAKFGQLAERLAERGIEPHEAAHFLNRVVFCLFAEDVGLLPSGHFSDIVQATKLYPEQFVKATEELFTAMANGGWSRLKQIRWFNGNLFSDSKVLKLTASELAVIDEVCTYNWGDIEPAIFGTLFERSLDPDKRSQIGAHYTHPDDILAVVEPVLMAPLRAEWEEVRQKVDALAALHEETKKEEARLRVPGSAEGPKARRVREQMERQLLDFLERLTRVRVLDPACGSGNFLYISLNLLKDLEKEVMAFGGTRGLTMPYDRVSPTQLHGIEINPYARELAQTAIWIGFIQWRRKNGVLNSQDPVLDPLDTIENRDAILDLSDPANPREPEWPEADVIVGNPPFVGDKRMRWELGDVYVNALRHLYKARLPGQADLVCYWFEKARALVAAGKAKRVGLLATQGIRGSANRQVLDRIKNSGDIFLAFSDRDWVLEGANVHVSIVGFDDGTETHKSLNGQPVSFINSNLTGGVDLTKARRLKDNRGISFFGVQRTGPFDLEEQHAREMTDAKGNPNGRPNTDVVKPWINALDVTQRPRQMWIVDFGTSMPIGQAAQYEKPFEYIRASVKPIRDKTRRKSHRERWWLFGESRPGLRKALTGLERYIVTPHVSKLASSCG